jgi:hypothetical protein
VSGSSDFNQEYADSDTQSGKDWNFPKMHSHKHTFNDIEAKGVTRNYNTKPNEKLHEPLKDSYKLRTNFKDVANQVCFTIITTAVLRVHLFTDLESRTLVFRVCFYLGSGE